ncbi:hypothetical protein [Halovenus aranensis]|nr:hypothetical protein [Halovenus aranensis]
MSNILSENGIEDVQTDDWYPARPFFKAVQEIASKAGDGTTFEIGRSMGQDVPLPDDVSSPHDMLSQYDTLHYDSYRNVDAQSGRSIGGYTYERIDATTCRMGVTEDFPYHTGIAQGSTEGLTSTITNGVVRGKEVETQPTDAQKNPERRAFRLSW